jgi:plasmid stability protein
MVDILVRGVDEAVAQALKAKARRTQRTLNEVARDALREAATPSREEILSILDAIRCGIAPLPDDSTALIREDRDAR